MGKYCFVVDLPDGKLDDIFRRMQEGVDIVRKCYYELEEIGLVAVKKEGTINTDTADGI